MIFLLIRRTYTYDGETNDHYVLAGTREQCVARVERMIRNNPKAKIREADGYDSWHITPPGGADQGFFGPRPLDLLIVTVPSAAGDNDPGDAA